MNVTAPVKVQGRSFSDAGGGERTARNACAFGAAPGAVGRAPVANAAAPAGAVAVAAMAALATAGAATAAVTTAGATTASAAASVAASVAAARTAAAGPGTWDDFLGDASRHVPSVPYPHAACFEQAARRHDLPLTLLLAVARGESNFDARARSSADALGVMQIRWPVTARHLGIQSRETLLHPCTNIDAGARYLVELIARYDGDLPRALAAYNMGPSRVAPAAPALPAAGQRYTRYLYEHLEALLGESRPPPAAAEPAGAPAGDAIHPAYPLEHPLVVFATPVRARAMIRALRAREPSLRLTLQARPPDRYAVSLAIADATAHAEARRVLRHAGFPLP